MKQVCSQLISCRQKTFLVGDKPHKLLARLLRKSQASQAILAVKNKNGQLVTDPKDINKCFEEFYCELYSSYSSASQATIDEFLEESKLTKLDEEAVADLEADFTLDEVKVAIQQFPNSKAPRPDGFRAKFYKTYSSLLAPRILRSSNHSKEVGSLPSSLQHGKISLILKKSDSTLVSSYRPVSLLPVKGFIPNCHIYFNMRRLFNIMYSPARSMEDSVVISLDAEKAFDQIEWPYLLSVLTKFGFSNSFIN